MTFSSLKLHPKLMSVLQELGYEIPTPIQLAAIPDALKKHDLLATADTGTGKTAAFLLPALHHLAESPRTKSPRVLVLVPTRELAIQVATQAKKYSAHLRDIRTVMIFGGTPYPVQKRDLSRPYDILVATPGRLIDHLEAGRINLSGVELLVLDEADRLLDMGFIDPVKQIAAATSSSRQTMMFSATLKGSVMKLSKQLLKNPVEVRIEPEAMQKDAIEERLHLADNLDHKFRLLDHILQDETLEYAIIFTSTKNFADQLMDKLSDDGHRVSALHGDMNQRQRTRTISMMRDGKIKILVATDVAARGIDLKSISHVINFDLPMTAEDYVHRIGRTGRAGAKGVALTFVMYRDLGMVKRIEQYTGKEIPKHVIPTLEPKLKASGGSRQDFRKGPKPAPRRDFRAGPRSGGRSSDRSDESSERSDRPPGRSFGRSSERSDEPSDRPAGRSFGRSSDRSTGRSFGRSDRPTTGRSFGKPGERSDRSDRPTTGRSFGRPGERSDRSDRPTTGRSFGRPGERPAGRLSERPIGTAGKKRYTSRDTSR